LGHLGSRRGGSSEVRGGPGRAAAGPAGRRPIDARGALQARAFYSRGCRRDMPYVKGTSGLTGVPRRPARMPPCRARRANGACRHCFSARSPPRRCRYWSIARTGR